MFKKAGAKIMGAAALIVATIGFAPEAKAYDQSYCREYNRTVHIGGQIQNAYGTACLQPDGDWVIVGEGLGADVPQNATNVTYIIKDNNRRIVPNRVIFYDRPYYRTRNVQPSFVWYHNGNYKNKHFVRRDKPHKHINHRPHHNDRHAHPGRGHGRD
jgi:hypothetical protein